MMVRFQYAINLVVRCWTPLVRRYGEATMESYVSPYVKYDPTEVSMLRIQNRADGFPLAVDATAANWDSSSELTTVEQPKYTKAFNASTRDDEFHRRTTTIFLKHCFDTVCSTTLYTANSAETWVTGTSLQSTSSTRRAPALNTVLPQDIKDYFDNLDPIPISSSSSSAPLRATRTATQRTARQARNASSSRNGRSTSGVPVLIQPPSSEQVTQAHSVVKSFLDNTYLHCYNSTFEEVCEGYDNAGGDNTELNGQVQLLLCDPPFNIRRLRDLPNSEYDKLTLGDMKRLVSLALQLVRPGGHVIFFCSIDQHPVWQELFRTVTDEGFEDNSTDEQEFNGYQALVDLQPLPTSNNFNVTLDPVLYINKPHHYTHGPRFSATHQNGTHYAFHCKRNGASQEEERNMVDWRNHGYVHSTYPAVKHIIDNVPRLAPGEQVRVRITSEIQEPDNGGSSNQEDTSTPTTTLRTEQKPTPLLQEIVCRYSQPGDKVVDLFGGTFSTAIATLSLPQHRVFIGTELDKQCFDVAMQNVYNKLASYIATGQTDIVIPQEVRDACNIIHRHNMMGRHDPLWQAPEGLPQYQKLPPSVVASLASSNNNPRWMLEFSSEPVDVWPLAMKVALMQADPQQLLHVDAAANGVMIARSGINHSNAGLGCFAARPFEKDELIGCYYGTLVYANLIDRVRTPRKEYGKGVMMVSRETFQTYAFQVYTNRVTTGFEAVTDLTDGRVSIHIVPPVFCSMRYINDARYLDGDSDRHTRTDVGARAPNVMYKQSRVEVKSPKHLEKNNIIEVRALEKINIGEELLGDYGSGYALFNSDQFHDGKL